MFAISIHVPRVGNDLAKVPIGEAVQVLFQSTFPAWGTT